MRPLLITESRAKAQSITRLLGPSNEVDAAWTNGHLFEIPPHREAIDRAGRIQHWCGVSAEALQELARQARGRSLILLCTDLDDEGELIAFHAQEHLSKHAPFARFQRVRLQALTPSHWSRALAENSDIDNHAVTRAIANRVFDRTLTLEAEAASLQPQIGRVITPLISAFDKNTDPYVGEIIDRRLTQCNRSMILRLRYRRSELKIAAILAAAFDANNRLLTLAANERIAPQRPVNTAEFCVSAARLHDLSPAETMAFLESLYLGGSCSYPRTSATTLTPNAAADLAKLFPSCEGALPGIVHDVTQRSPHSALQALSLPRPSSEQHPRRNVHHLLTQHTQHIGCQDEISIETLGELLPTRITNFLPVTWRLQKWQIDTHTDVPGVQHFRFCNGIAALVVMSEHRIGQPSTYAHHTMRADALFHQYQPSAFAQRCLASAAHVAPGLCSPNAYAHLSATTDALLRNTTFIAEPLETASQISKVLLQEIRHTPRTVQPAENANVELLSSGLRTANLSKTS